MTVFKTRRNKSESRDNFGPSALVKRAKEELAKEEEVKTAAFTSFPSSWTGRRRASPLHGIQQDSVVLGHEPFH